MMDHEPISYGRTSKSIEDIAKKFGVTMRQKKKPPFSITRSNRFSKTQSVSSCFYLNLFFHNFLFQNGATCVNRALKFPIFKNHLIEFNDFASVPKTVFEAVK